MKRFVFSLALVSISFLLVWHALVTSPPTQLPQEHRESRSAQGLPTRLIIPAIHVEANIQNLGVTPEGVMEVPTNAVDVSWFKLGSLPGQTGSAVIAGHFDSVDGKPGVFTALNRLKKGDTISVLNDKGETAMFVVRESRLYNPGFAEDVFTANDGIHLNLVTCDGVWDGTTKSYSKRLVVFSDMVRE